MEEKCIWVTHQLPDNNQKVKCFGHKTLCCKEDADEIPEWHEVTFKFEISSYKLKKQLPEDLEESILEYCQVIESWEIGQDFSDGHVIGVSKWKNL